MKKIKGELTIKAFTDGRNTKVVVTGPKDIRARQLGNVSLTGTARCHEEDYENSWIGLCIALGRALQIPKEDIEKLSNALCKKKSLIGAVYKDIGMITSRKEYQNGKVVYSVLRFEPVTERISKNCEAQSWSFRVDANKITLGDITYKNYKIIERKDGQEEFAEKSVGSIVKVVRCDGRLETAFIRGFEKTRAMYDVFTVQFFSTGEILRVATCYVKALGISRDYKVVIE